MVNGRNIVAVDGFNPMVFINQMLNYILPYKFLNIIPDVYNWFCTFGNIRHCVAKRIFKFQFCKFFKHIDTLIIILFNAQNQASIFLHVQTQLNHQHCIN